MAIGARKIAKSVWLNARSFSEQDGGFLWLMGEGRTSYDLDVEMRLIQIGLGR